MVERWSGSVSTQCAPEKKESKKRKTKKNRLFLRLPRPHAGWFDLVFRYIRSLSSRTQSSLRWSSSISREKNKNSGRPGSYGPILIQGKAGPPVEEMYGTASRRNDGTAVMLAERKDGFDRQYYEAEGEKKANVLLDTSSHSESTRSFAPLNPVALY